MNKLKDIRSSLLKKFCIEHPNAYVQIGDTYHPTRLELFSFEMFNKMFESGIVNYKDNIPILLTLKESERVFFESFEDLLVYGKPLEIKGSADTEIAWILFLNSFLNNIEFKEVLNEIRPWNKTHLFQLETWTRLMEYELDSSFLDFYDKLEICAVVSRQSLFDPDGKKRCHQQKEYGNYLLYITEQNLKEKDPKLEKAMKFCNVTLEKFKAAYPYRTPESSHYGPN
jgi:hypothetical protein